MVGIARCTECQLYTLYIEQCSKEEIQSDGDSSSDDWSSLAVNEIRHLSDYCMRALYCCFMLSVNTALSNYTTCTGQNVHNIVSLLKLMSSILILHKQYACKGCQSVITAKAHGHNFMGQLSINKNSGV